MFNKRNILSLTTLIVGASASGIFRQFGDKITATTQKINPCHITCPREYAPVCATDAETYENICLFGVARCMNKDLQLVANVTCPDLLIHLTYLAQNSFLEGFNAVNSTYQAVGNLTKGTADMISSVLESIPLITLPNFNIPVFGIPPISSQILKTSSTSTSTTTINTSSTTDSANTELESDSDSNSDSTSTSTSSTSIVDFTSTSAVEVSTSTVAVSTSTASASSTVAVSTSTSVPSTTPASSTNPASSTASAGFLRKLIEIPSLEQGASGVITQVTKTIQSALSGNGVGGSSSPAALGLNNLDDAKTTIEGMVKTIPYTPGRNSSNILLVDGISQKVKLPNGIDGKNLLFANITSPSESISLPNITNLTNGSLSNITERISNRNITTLNGENFMANSNLQSLRNLTSSTLENNNITNNNLNSTLLTNSTLNKLISGKFNTTDIFRGIGNTINNISKSIKDQVENEIENLN